MAAYHDAEWGVPLHDDRALFEFLILEGAQAGLSWSTILRKRENYRKAFDGFDPRKIARYDDRKMAALLEDAGIVRNRLKIGAAVSNAQAFLAAQKEFGSFDRYIWTFTGGRPIQNRWKSSGEVPARTAESDAISKDLVKRKLRFTRSFEIASDSAVRAGTSPEDFQRFWIGRPPGNVQMYRSKLPNSFCAARKACALETAAPSFSRLRTIRVSSSSAAILRSSYRAILRASKPSNALR